MTVDLGFRLFAHRGASALLPENTLAAFARGLRDGANALELDVHRTRDGHFVVCHDPDGRRMAGVPERVAEATLAEVKRWDVGRGFVGADGGRSEAGRGHTVPTLAEVLEAFPGVPLSVELKPDAPWMAPSLVELVTRHGAERLVTLASFRDRVVAAVRACGYPGPTALSRREVGLLFLLPPSLLEGRIAGVAAHVPPRTHLLRLDTASFLARCRRLGLRTEYWTVNDPEVALQLVRRGATGIMTDDPARIAPRLRGLR